MMAALWGDVERDIASSRHHFRQAIALFRAGLATAAGDLDYVRMMAFLHAMQSGFTSFETALKRVLSMLDEPMPSSFDSHRALLERVGVPSTAGDRPAILDTAALRRAADRLRAFCHVAAHVYDDFDVERAALAVPAAETFVAEVGPALARFRAAMDGDGGSPSSQPDGN